MDYNQHKDVILQSLVAADELGLNKLMEHIQEYLTENHDFLLKDPVGTLEIIYQHETFETLKDYCLEIISEEPRILFASQKFPSLEKSIIDMIFQRDDLNMKEIDIWESLLRWLFVHYLKIDKDEGESMCTPEDLTNVKKTIQDFIPSIRFYDISKEDFYLKVYPYKNFLPQDLLNDILRYHMIPNSTSLLNLKPSRCPKIDSVLINYAFFKLFAKWIDKRNDDYTEKDMPYKFTLLLRGTRDGFDSAKFHQLCDNKGATISVARIKDSKQIVGGYNPLNWNSQGGQYLNTNDSFLFNITDRNNLNSAKIGRVFRNQQNAIYNHSSYGPTFGGGHDLRSQGNNNWVASDGHTYTSTSIPNNFTIDEYEVFQVVKRV